MLAQAERKLGLIRLLKSQMGVSEHEAQRALMESNWNLDAAMDWLRRKTSIKG